MTMNVDVDGAPLARALAAVIVTELQSQVWWLYRFKGARLGTMPTLPLHLHHLARAYRSRPLGASPDMVPFDFERTARP
jgi:hypothetical protein